MKDSPIYSRVLRKCVAELSYLGQYYCGFENKIHNPVFIIGCGRSGTTMLAEHISTHRDIAVFPSEANDLWNPKSHPCFLKNPEKPPTWIDPKRFSEITINEIDVDDIKKMKRIFGFYQSIMKKKIFLVKSAIITFYIPLLIKTFPNLRLIHIYRDGRAVAFSWARKQMKRIKKCPEPYIRKGYFVSFEGMLEKCSKAWKEHIIEIEEQKSKLSLIDRKILYEIKYEDYCIDPIKYLGECAQFLSLEGDRFQGIESYMTENMNVKFQKELNTNTIKTMSEIMRPALEIKGYKIN